MVEYFRINGLNNVLFDQAAAAANNRYRLVQRRPPKGIDKPLTREETLPRLRQLPEKIRSHVLSQQGEHLMSVITFPFNIQGTSDADMEDAEHDLRETLEDTKLYFSTRGARGTEAQLQVKSDLAAASSYKSIFHGEFNEDGGRQILGGSIKEHYIEGLQMTLYCEPYWHPASGTAVATGSYYNHDDADANHDNFDDILAANILGDVPGPTHLLLEIPGIETGNVKWIYVARRSLGTPSSFDHWLEAEDANSQTNWADAVDTSRSAGDIVSDNANTSGQIVHFITANLDHFKGRLGIYGSFWTDDIVNTRFRLRWYFSDSSRKFYGNWKFLGKASTWQLLQLATIDIDPTIFPPGDTVERLNLYTEYEKDASDTVKCDYIMLLPLDESVMLIELSSLLLNGTTQDSFEVDGTKDFPNAYITEAATGDFTGYAFVRGDYLTLQPNVDNRIYIKFLSAANYNDPYSQHQDVIGNADGADAEHLDGGLVHLPYYISPLE